MCRMVSSTRSGTATNVQFGSSAMIRRWSRSPAAAGFCTSCGGASLASGDPTCSRSVEACLLSRSASTTIAVGDLTPGDVELRFEPGLLVAFADLILLLRQLLSAYSTRQTSYHFQCNATNEWTAWIPGIRPVVLTENRRPSVQFKFAMSTFMAPQCFCVFKKF